MRSPRHRTVRIDWIDRIDRINRIDRIDRIDRIAWIDWINRIARIDRINRINRINRIDRIDRIDRINRIDRIDRIDRINRIARIDRIDRIDRIRRTDWIRAIDPIHRTGRTRSIARLMTRSVILLRSHGNVPLTLRRIRSWHEANPRSVIVYYDGSGGEALITDDPALNLVAFPRPRRQAYGMSWMFDAFRWMAEQFPGAWCHYTEYDSVPVRDGYVDALQLDPRTVLAGESHPGAQDFRIGHEECRYRAIDVIGKILNVPVLISYGFGPSLIYGAECVRYLGEFDEDDFERHVRPALERIRPGYVYEESVWMSLLAGGGMRRVFNPAARFLLCRPADEAAVHRARADGEAFAVHAVKDWLPWER